MRARWLVSFAAMGIAMSAGVWAQSETAGRAVAQDAAKEPKPPASVTVIGARDAHGILGREVRSAADENMGRIVDAIVDRSGTVRAAVIDFGGFLGVGSRKIVVDWNALHVSNEQPDQISVDLTRDQVREAPEYKPGKPVVMLGALPNTASSPEM